MRVLLVTVVILGLLAGSASLPPATAQGARPNIIFILTDDLDAKSIAYMPRLKTLLADQGASFANFFVTTSLCCPSRSSILRGQYVHNHRVYTNTPPSGGFEVFHGLGRENSTIATWLRAAGYRTVLMGKYLNGYPDRADPTYVPPGWEEWYSPARGGYANFNYTMNENGKLVSYGSRPEDYMTDVLSRKAVDVIQRSARDGRPFFIYLATYAPHAPATPAPRHAGLFGDVKLPRPPSFNEVDVSGKPQWVQNRPLLSTRVIAQLEEHYRTRLRSLAAVDEMIGALVEALRAAGRLDQTYIFFTSDNGFHMGEHRLPLGKNTVYEEDICVPFIVHGPGVASGQMREHLAMNIDLAPTFAAIARVSAPEFVDGRSLLPVLQTSPPALSQWRQAFVAEHFRGAPLPPGQQGRRLGQRAIPDAFALRARDFVYIEYETGERELYNLQADPYELRNLAGLAPQALLARLSARLSDLKQCSAAACRAAEDAPLDTRGFPH